MFPKQLELFYDLLERKLRDAGIVAGAALIVRRQCRRSCSYGIIIPYEHDLPLISGVRKSGRHMKYPYTFCAKIAQFPMFFYMKKNWIWMYYPMGWAVGGYFISKVHNLANSDANKHNWAETQRKFAEKEHHN